MCGSGGGDAMDHGPKDVVVRRVSSSALAFMHSAQSALNVILFLCAPDGDLSSYTAILLYAAGHRIVVLREATATRRPKPKSSSINITSSWVIHLKMNMILCVVEGAPHTHRN